MVDTVRTLSALQTLLADNTAGDISAQDVRDFLVSAYSPFLVDVSATPININSVTPVTIVSQDITNVAAGDIVRARLTGALSNNSGGTKTYSIVPDFDGAFAPGTNNYVTALGASANPRPFEMEWTLAVISTSVARLHVTSALTDASLQAAGAWNGSQRYSTMVDTTTTDLTGTVTVSLTVTSDNATATQTLEPYTFEIWRLRTD
jgi:hypothetical protein